MRQIYYLLLLIGLTILSGCGESGNASSDEIATSSGIQLNITLDKNLQKSNPNRFEKQSDVNRIELDFEDNTGLVKTNIALNKIANKWSKSLLLNPTNAPFTFRVRAYDTSNKLLYSGKKIVQNITTSKDINITLKAEEPIALSILPFVKNITQTQNAQGIDFNFEIVNYKQDSLQYGLGSITPLNDSCPSPFQPSSGVLSIFNLSNSETVLNSLLIPDTNLSCKTDQYSIGLLTNNRDYISTLFTLDNNNNISINFPPEIEFISVTENNSSFELVVTASDSDGPAPIHYSWSLKEGNVSISGQNNLDTLLLTGYLGVGRIVLDLNVSDSGGAMSHISYVLHGNYSASTIQKTIQTGQKTSYKSFDDGYYRKGRNRNFTRDTTTGIVTDFTQDLMWEDNLTLTTRILNWNDANSTCKAMSLGGYNNWRLPTIQELVNLSDKSKYQPALPIEFTYSGLQNANSRNAEAWYWSSTTEYYNPTNKAWIMFEDTGHITWSATANTQYVRCVRDIN